MGDVVKSTRYKNTLFMLIFYSKLIWETGLLCGIIKQQYYDLLCPYIQIYLHEIYLFLVWSVGLVLLQHKKILLEYVL